jgi:hypothetical protein
MSHEQAPALLFWTLSTVLFLKTKPDSETKEPHKWDLVITCLVLGVLCQNLEYTGLGGVSWILVSPLLLVSGLSLFFKILFEFGV